MPYRALRHVATSGTRRWRRRPLGRGPWRGATNPLRSRGSRRGMASAGQRAEQQRRRLATSGIIRGAGRFGDMSPDAHEFLTWEVPPAAGPACEPATRRRRAGGVPSSMARPRLGSPPRPSLSPSAPASPRRRPGGCTHRWLPQTRAAGSLRSRGCQPWPTRCATATCPPQAPIPDGPRLTASVQPRHVPRGTARPGPRASAGAARLS